jgi:hypothetical protein
MISKKHDPADGEILFFQGFPGQNTSLNYEGVTAIPLAYATYEIESKEIIEKFHTDFDMDFHFSIVYTSTDSVSMNDEDPLSKPPIAKGLSGSLVWDTKYVECLRLGKKWSPELARVTGIIWGWDKKNEAIFATRIEHFLDFLRLTNDS